MSPSAALVGSPLTPAARPACSQTTNVMDAVCKVFCVHSEPDFSLPWQRRRQYSSSSSAFVIALDTSSGPRRYLLTNAHSVEHHAQARGPLAESKAVAGPRSGLGEVTMWGVHQPAHLSHQLFPLSLSPLSPFLVQVKVKRRDDDSKFIAQVLAVGAECDMALLTGL